MSRQAAGSGAARSPSGGGRLEEPATTVTDWVMAVCAGAWAALLIADGQRRGPAGLATVVWGVAFAATALAALLGGVVHGFQRRTGEVWAERLWRTTVHAMTVASLALGAAAVLVFPSAWVRAVGLGVLAGKWIWVTARLVRNPGFRVALADAAMSLALVLALQGAAWWQDGAGSLPWIAAGVALSGAAAAIQAREIAPHPRFNHNDLFHIVQIGALWALYRGGLLLTAS